MPRLIEVECRRPGWRPGAEVVLADGQAWHFPRPALVYRVELDPTTRQPRFRADASRQSTTYGARLDQLDASRNGGPYFSRLTALALELLDVQYQIPDASVPELFVFDPASSISLHRWEAIRQAVLGMGPYPKP